MNNTNLKILGLMLGVTALLFLAVFPTPGLAQASKSKCTSLASSGKLDEAITCYEQYIEENRRDSKMFVSINKAKFELGILYSRKGNQDKANTTLTEVYAALKDSLNYEEGIKAGYMMAMTAFMAAKDSNNANGIGDAASKFGLVTKDLTTESIARVTDPDIRSKFYQIYESARWMAQRCKFEIFLMKFDETRETTVDSVYARAVDNLKSASEGFSAQAGKATSPLYKAYAIAMQAECYTQLGRLSILRVTKSAAFADSTVLNFRIADSLYNRLESFASAISDSGNGAVGNLKTNLGVYAKMGKINAALNLAMMGDKGRVGEYQKSIGSIVDASPDNWKDYWKMRSADIEFAFANGEFGSDMGAYFRDIPKAVKKYGEVSDKSAYGIEAKFWEATMAQVQDTMAEAPALNRKAGKFREFIGATQGSTDPRLRYLRDVAKLYAAQDYLEASITDKGALGNVEGMLAVESDAKEIYSWRGKLKFIKDKLELPPTMFRNAMQAQTDAGNLVFIGKFFLKMGINTANREDFFEKAIMAFDKAAQLTSGSSQGAMNRLFLGIAQTYLANIRGKEFGNAENSLAGVRDPSVAVEAKYVRAINKYNEARVNRGGPQLDQAIGVMREVYEAGDLRAAFWLGGFFMEKGNKREACVYFQTFRSSVSALPNYPFKFYLTNAEISLQKVGEACGGGERRSDPFKHEVSYEALTSKPSMLQAYLVEFVELWKKFNSAKDPMPISYDPPIFVSGTKDTLAKITVNVATKRGASEYKIYVHDSVYTVTSLPWIKKLHREPTIIRITAAGCYPYQNLFSLDDDVTIEDTLYSAMDYKKSGTVSGSFTLPQEISTDPDGRIYVVDAGNRTVKRFLADGSVDGDFKLEGPFLSFPTAASTDNDGNVYVLDGRAGVVYKYNNRGGFLDWSAGRGVLCRPRAMVNVAGILFITDAGLNKIVSITADGGIDSLPVLLNSPEGITADAMGNLIVADWGTNRVIKVSREGKPVAFDGLKKMELGVLGGASGDPGKFAYPRRVSVDKEGFIYVADETRIQKFDQVGNYLQVVGASEKPVDPYAAAVVGEKLGSKLFLVDRASKSVGIFGASEDTKYRP